MKTRTPGTGFGQDVVFDNAFGRGKGMSYGRWIDSVSGSSRSNGHNEGDAIQEPGGILESILRDHVFAERGLIRSSRSSDTIFTMDGVLNSTDDYYNNSEYVCVTTGFKTYVSDYTGNTKSFTIASADTGSAVNDNIFLTNVNGDNSIDIVSFDAIGNTTNGLRKDWVFARSIYTQTDTKGIIASLLTESRLFLFKSHNKYKIKSKDDLASSPDTWANPLKSEGRAIVKCGLSSIRQLYNDFRVNYHFDYGSQEYKKTLFVNRSAYSSNLSSGSTYKTTCETLYNNYGGKSRGFENKFEYNCDWIYDDDTAELFFDKIFSWYSKQRMIVSWAGDIENYITYEVGDQVILNYSPIIPTGINNTAQFIIDATRIKPLAGAPYIEFKLIEVS